MPTNQIEVPPEKDLVGEYHCSKEEAENLGPTKVFENLVLEGRSLNTAGTRL
jgi:hypothetical protein